MKTQINQKYLAKLLFQIFWQTVDLGNQHPGELFTKDELELIKMYIKHPKDRQDPYLLMVYEAFDKEEYRL